MNGLLKKNHNGARPVSFSKLIVEFKITVIILLTASNYQFRNYESWNFAKSLTNQNILDKNETNNKYTRLVKLDLIGQSIRENLSS